MGTAERPRALVNVEMEFGQVVLTAKKMAEHLKQLGVPYAIIGGLAVYQHGYPRTTKDVDILIPQESLKKIHEALVGLGYLPVFQGSKNLRDTETRVPVEFVIVGQFPGDGKPKPVSFPDPSVCSLEVEQVRFADLKTIIELKLASGMTAPYRQLQDFADVQNLIRTNKLDRTFADKLNPYVRDKFLELWSLAQQAPPLE
jgi:hypothetical protein